jgi:hypothetical protein
MAWQALAVRVYVSVAAGIDPSVLLEVLAELDATVSTSEETSLLDDHLTDDLGPIAAVVALFAGPAMDRGGAVQFEAGIALGRGLPLLIVSEEASPFTLNLGDVSGAHVAELRGTISNREALRFHLGLFLKEVPEVALRTTSADSARGNRLDIRPLRRRFDEIHSVSGSHPGLELERLVSDIFSQSGLEVALAQREDRGFDLVAAMPSLGLGGRPLVVEIKSVRNPSNLNKAALALQYLVLQERAGLGLLLFDDAQLPSGLALSVVPMVITLGIGELLRDLETETLYDVLIRARNDAVHRL